MMDAILFQSTPSAWRETIMLITRKRLSIHFNPLPPHGGRLSDIEEALRSEKYFNPLPPHGGRQRKMRQYGCDFLFQSTPSAWRETIHIHTVRRRNTISIHSLRMEGDVRRWVLMRNYEPFQSTPSAWRETVLGGRLRQ